ncbi:glycosyltransferase [Sporosarcina sp. ACRSL]|uniref:glycosyltransferase n=1 Tax=Sporosarcina sp. ACRSL TaxID=2918215 RepID=UPI001EF4243C|nr:glycosyltransferase [Sporosarcina sp. ACRSL]MCG7344291.1 glycosyltransferase [Sporosarcina sp. ACRSL]
MRRIAVFSNMYPSEKHPTFGIFVKNQVELLRSKGIEVDLIAIDEPGKGKVATLKKYVAWFLKSIGFLLKNKNHISLTHAHYAFPTGVLSLIGKRLFGIPYVVTVHGGDIDKMAAKSARIANYTRKVLQGADTVIVVGERLKQDVITKFGVKEEHVHVMSMGVNTDIFKPMPKEEARQQLDIPSNEKLLLYVGNMIEAKGVLDLVDAFETVQKAHPNASLHFIGSSKDENFMERFKTRLQSDNHKITHQEPLSQQRIAKWIAAADVFVLPSHHEGFGLVALEAMAVGTTVVGSDVGGLSFLLGNEAGILVEPRNPDSLAAGLQQALEEPSDTRKTIAEETVAKHTYHVIAERLMAIYDAVSKGKSVK